jgi:hypothetical protein
LVKSRGVQLMLHAPVGDGLSFDPFSFCQDDRPASEVDCHWHGHGGMTTLIAGLAQPIALYVNLRMPS